MTLLLATLTFMIIVGMVISGYYLLATESEATQRLRAMVPHLVAPQQKQRKQHEERLRNLKRGDMIVTSGGIVGEIVHMKEPKEGGGERSMEDQITIKSAESRLVIERGRIAKVITPAAGATS